MNLVIPEALQLQDDDIKELLRLSRFYWKEALRCEKTKAYLAGCVMLGAAMESLLILMVEIYPEDAMLAGSLPKAKNGEIESLLKWDLADLLRVSKKAGWLPHSLQPGDGFDAKKALVGDYLEILRQIRNLLHPGRYVREHSKKRVTNKHLQMSFEVCLAARDWLYNRVAKSLREHLKGQD